MRVENVHFARINGGSRSPPSEVVWLVDIGDDAGRIRRHDRVDGGFDQNEDENVGADPFGDGRLGSRREDAADDRGHDQIAPPVGFAAVPVPA